jgi:hypothetical protein
MNFDIFGVISRYRKLLIYLVVLLGISIPLYMASQYGRVSIDSDIDGPVTLVNQNNDESVNIEIRNGSGSSVVKKGSYEVLVLGDQKTAWTTFSAKGFFMSTTISLISSPEKQRTFIGNSVKSCNYYDQQLLSYSCGDAASGMFVHSPASGSMPPLASQVAGDIHGTLIDVTPSQGTFIGLFKSQSEDGSYIAYSLDRLPAPSFTPAEDYVFIDVFDESEELGGLHPYKQGFIVYNTSFTAVYYFASIEATPQKIPFPSVDDDLVGYDIEATGDSIAISYTNNPDYEPNSTDTAPKGMKGATTYITPTEVKTFQHEGEWNNITPCGNNQLCGIRNTGASNSLDILDTNGDALKVTSSIANANQIYSVSNNTLVATDTAIISISHTTNAKVVDYSFRGYNFCGFGRSINPDEYVVCVSDSAQIRALLISSKFQNNDSIDRAVQKLQESDSVDTVVADRKNLFIVLEYGDGDRNQEDGGFDINYANVDKARAEVESIVQSLKLGDLGYTVQTLL